MADNKDKKVLKSSIEREQNQTCLNSAEREKIKGSMNLNVPHLRFPEFTEEWKRKRFKDVCNITTGNKNTQDKSDDGIYPFYVRSQIVERINSWTFDGEAILTAGDGVGVGKVFHYSTGKIGVHQRVYILSDFKCDGKYLYSYFAGNFYNRVKRMSAKNSVDSVRMEMIADMPISLPSNEEQKKIGHLLALLDERIATQNKIIEDLKLLKSAIAETVFNNMKGYLTTNLSTICNIVKGKQVNGEELSEKGKYYVMNGGITPSGYYDQCNTPANTISISEGGNSCGYVQYNKSSFWSGGHCYTLQDISSGVETQYLFHYLKRYESNIMNLRIGTGLPNIQKKDLENFRIVLPPSNVQKEIATCLTAIEHKILVEINWLDSVQKEKQHLLRQMFI